eukprot:TRINITY_DN20756_c0_g1_i1.p1 TRINITY_DN20756_c0_g1~~TRINITY_DN20756_c0_g1_i1.p1  ORF type:complete len:144 (-),score=15.99 TRINITY_DN20756_c0_g1_i1:130-561(-)
MGATPASCVCCTSGEDESFDANTKEGVVLGVGPKLVTSQGLTMHPDSPHRGWDDEHEPCEAAFSELSGFYSRVNDLAYMAEIQGDTLVWAVRFQCPRSRIRLTAEGKLTLDLQGAAYTADWDRGSGRLTWSDGEVWKKSIAGT